MRRRAHHTPGDEAGMDLAAPRRGAAVWRAAMAGESAPPVTDADIRALAARLKGLDAVLTPGEQTLFHAVLQRATGPGQAAPEDEWIASAVSFNPFVYLDAIAAELARSARP